MAELSNGFVCLMGMGTVFIGLVCIVLICKLTSMVVRSISPKTGSNSASAKPASTPAKGTSLPPAEKSAVIAGICAVIAEELGTDANNIKVLSFKQL